MPFATHKRHHSAYLHTPSDSVCVFCIHFSYQPIKLKKSKKTKQNTKRRSALFGTPSGTKPCCASLPRSSTVSLWLTVPDCATCSLKTVHRTVFFTLQALSGFESLFYITKKQNTKRRSALFGTPSGTRTLDTLIKSQVLYQLS